MTSSICTAIDEDGPCKSLAVAHGYCPKHDRRLRRHGSVISHQPKDLGNSSLVSFKLEAVAVAKVKRLAKTRGVSEATVYRDAVDAYLKAR